MPFWNLNFQMGVTAAPDLLPIVIVKFWAYLIKHSVCWENFKQNWKYFQWDLLRIKEHTWEVQSIFCIINTRIHLLGSTAHSAWIGSNWAEYFLINLLSNCKDFKMSLSWGKIFVPIKTQNHSPVSRL